ncbi:hypothetical protein SRHO_G00221950, partial [Serrasalmus rhombeus]
MRSCCGVCRPAPICHPLPPPATGPSSPDLTSHPTPIPPALEPLPTPSHLDHAPPHTEWSLLVRGPPPTEAHQQHVALLHASQTPTHYPD